MSRPSAPLDKGQMGGGWRMADSESGSPATRRSRGRWGVSDFVSERSWAAAYPSGQFLVILRFSARRPTIYLLGLYNYAATKDRPATVIGRAACILINFTTTCRVGKGK